MGKVLQDQTLEIWGDGNVTRDYIYIGDVCAAVLLLLQKPQWNNTFNIGSGRGYTINEIIKCIKKVTGKEIHVKYTDGRSVDIPVNIVNSEKLRIATGWKPLVSLEEGIANLWKEMH